MSKKTYFRGLFDKQHVQRAQTLLITVSQIEWEKVFLSDLQNLKAIHIKLSHKKKTFSRISFAFLRSILNLEHFQKEDDPHNWCILEITDSEKRG